MICPRAIGSAFSSALSSSPLSLAFSLALSLFSVTLSLALSFLSPLSLLSASLLSASEVAECLAAVFLRQRNDARSWLAATSVCTAFVPTASRRNRTACAAWSAFSRGMVRGTSSSRERFLLCETSAEGWLDDAAAAVDRLLCASLGAATAGVTPHRVLVEATPAVEAPAGARAVVAVPRNGVRVERASG
eukprot:6183293-Pleurochrysis_carterae.AAC.4